jgi:hypothetical protein
MDDRSVFELSPQISGDSQKLFTRFRLFAIAGLFLAMLAAAWIIG